MANNNWNAARNLAGRGIVGDAYNFMNNEKNSFDSTYKTVNLPRRPDLPVINRNLANRSRYVERNIVPSPYIKVEPTEPNPFSANLQVNMTHKGTVYGSKPENILNRYRFQKGLFAKELEQKQYNLRQINLENAKQSAALQQEINSANSLRKIHEREMDEAIQRAKNSAELSLARKTNANTKRKLMEAQKMQRMGQLFPAPPKKPVAAQAAPVKKSLWQRMTGRGRNTRKQRKTRKNRRN